MYSSYVLAQPIKLDKNGAACSAESIRGKGTNPIREYWSPKASHNGFVSVTSQNFHPGPKRKATVPRSMRFNRSGVNPICSAIARRLRR